MEQIKGFENYSIDRNGSVYGKRGVIKPNLRNGYHSVGLYKDGICVKASVHRLVANTFIPNPDNKETVNHKNAIRIDNRVENLEWNTQQESVKHAMKLGLKAPMVGERNREAKLTEAKVVRIKELLSEGCTQTEIAKKYRVTQANISLIKRGVKWAHV